MTDRICSDLTALRPEVERIARVWAHICKDDLGIEIKVLETLRTKERQEEQQKAGRSQNKIGWHNFGMAWDFGVFIAGVYQTNDRSGLYKKCGMIGMALGCRWGGNWDDDTTLMEVSENDLGHLEYHPGFTLQQWINHGGGAG